MSKSTEKPGPPGASRPSDPVALLPRPREQPPDRSTDRPVELRVRWKCIAEGSDVLATTDGKAIGYVNRTIDHTGRERWQAQIGGTEKRPMAMRDRERARTYVTKIMAREAEKVGLALVLEDQNRRDG